MLGMEAGMETKKKLVAEALEALLADTYVLYLKTHNFHWNITGPFFTSLHALFETQYLELFAAVDEIAERIRSLGFVAPGTTKKYNALANLKEVEGIPSATEMVVLLAKDHRLIDKTAYRVFAAAEAANDQATIELVTRRMQVHEKIAWMLESQIG